MNLSLRSLIPGWTSKGRLANNQPTPNHCNCMLGSMADRCSRVLRSTYLEITHREQYLHELLRGGHSRRARRAFRALEEAHAKRRILESLAGPPMVQPTKTPSTTGVYQLVVSSWMLVDSFRLCTSTTDEGMHFLVGVQMSNARLATRIVEFAYAHRSRAGASGEHRATHQACIEVHEGGHYIAALMHSHPGNGPGANFHSSIDQTTHRLWESHTRLIGGIFSRDGYLRWFSVGIPFRVHILGSHFQPVDTNLWRLRHGAAP